MSKTDHPGDDIEILMEVARRANWDALHGPMHLRSGRFRPELTPPTIGESSPPAGAAFSPPARTKDEPERHET